MKTLTKLIFLAFVALSTACATTPDHKNNVQKFYDLLSNPGSESHAAAFKDVTTENWESVGDYSGKNKNREAFLGQMGGFAKLIPDLDWQVQSMHQDGDTVVVRSRAKGTPKGPLFGVDGEGKGFEILTIDIHEMENGLIKRSFHVEDWAGALRQLAGPKPKPNGDADKKSLDTVTAFMGAMGSGDMEKMSSLMAEDMVWHNEGDSGLPWIGTWKGKEKIFAFLGTFSKNVETLHWENQDLFASGDTVAVFGRMKLKTTKSGKQTEEFTFGLRAKVKDGKVVLWNWLEDSYAVSEAYSGK